MLWTEDTRAAGGRRAVLKTQAPLTHIELPKRTLILPLFPWADNQGLPDSGGKLLTGKRYQNNQREIYENTELMKGEENVFKKSFMFRGKIF